MKRVVIEDRHGWKRAYLIPDHESEENAEQGIPDGPPNFEQIDWNSVARDLNNQLIERGIYTWQDVQREQNAVTTVVRSSLVSRIVRLYRQEERHE